MHTHTFIVDMIYRKGSAFYSTLLVGEQGNATCHGQFKNCPKSLLVESKNGHFRPFSVIVEYESTRTQTPLTETSDNFSNCPQPQMRHFVCLQDKLNKKLNTKSVSFIFNKTFLQENLQPIYIYIYIYMRLYALHYFWRCSISRPHTQNWC